MGFLDSLKSMFGFIQTGDSAQTTSTGMADTDMADMETKLAHEHEHECGCEEGCDCDHHKSEHSCCGSGHDHCCCHDEHHEESGETETE